MTKRARLAASLASPRAYPPFACLGRNGMSPSYILPPRWTDTIGGNWRKCRICRTSLTNQHMLVSPKQSYYCLACAEKRPDWKKANPVPVPAPVELP